MSDNDNVWNRPKAPPPPLFTGKKEKDLAKQVSDELSERIVKSSLLYYPISIKHTNFHSLYGEAIDKNFLPPVKVDSYIEWDGEETTTDSYGIEKKSSITVHFQKRRVTEDKNLYVREGDFVFYGSHFYEIVTLQQPRLMFGQIDAKIEIVAKCVRARDGTFPKQEYTTSTEEDPRLTQPAYDPVNELNVVETTGDVNGAICKDDQVKHNQYTTQENPPPPLFAGKKERDLTKQISDEVLERVIGQQVVYFPVSIKHSDYHNLYGESVNKTFLPPIRTFAAVEWLGSDTETTYLGLDKTSKISVKFHKKRLTEDQNLFVREGDYLLYGNILYEITILKSPRLLFGQINNKYEIIAECIRARQGVFTLTKKKVPSGDEIDETSLTACENASFIQKVEGEKNTVKNVGTGEGFYAKKVGSELQFKSLKGGNNVTLSSTSTEITINTAATISGTISNAHTASLAMLANTASYIAGQNVYGAVSLANTASYYVETDTLATVVARGNSTAATLSVAGISASANISASAFYGDGANITGVTAEWDGSHTGNASITGNLTLSSNLSASGHISASSFVGNGANLKNIAAGNIDGTVANATNAVTAQTASYVVTALTASYYAETDTLSSVVSRGASTSGTLSVSGVSASSNISASAFYGSGANLTGISTASTLDQITDNGNTTTNNITIGNMVSTTMTGSLTKLRDGSAYLRAGSNISLVTGSSGQVTISAASGSSSDGNIGTAEDGSYADGLFTDFITSTPVGTAVDRFNEILKILAPSPAPDVSRINASTGAGVSSKLSFGSSNTISGYTNVSSIGSFSALNVTGTCESATSGDDFRRGTYNGASNIEGIVNFHVTADTYDNAVNNYPADSFGNSEVGILELYINGALAHSINLTSSAIGSGNPGSGAGTHVNGDGSGFINVSVTASAEDRSQNAFNIFQHRTAKYRVHTAEQRNGLNYAQVKHSGSWGRKTTNYVQWVNDNNSNALAASNARFANETGLGSKYLSGVQYFTSASANYLVEVSNAYKSVYTSQNISFTTTNCSISSQAFPDLNTGAGDDETKVLQITGSATTSTKSLSGSIQSSVNVAHPLKSDLSNGGSASSTGLLIYNPSGNSTALRERFREETYRLFSGSYDAQSDVDSGTWNSQTHMTASGTHSDGLQLYNARLYSPLNTIQSGDFRDNSEGGPFGLSPAGNPNYSGETGTRTFFRYFRNSTGATKRDISLVINGSSTTIVPVGTALNSGRIRAFVKIPGATGFMDVAQAFAYDNTAAGSGAYVLSFDNSVDATNYMTFGTKGIANGEDIVLKIEADTSWTGYVDDIQVAFGAGTGAAPSEAPALDDIDINDAGAGVKLSFGASKAIGGYTSVSTNTGNSAVDVNGNFLDSGDIAGVFDGTTVIDGELNEDVSANGTSYVANSFNNAATGSLKLEVNGAVIHTIDLANGSVGSGNPGSGTDSELNGNSSGFVSLSTYKPGLYATNSLPDYTKLYRTGKYQVGAADQRNGWNYARVVHTGSGIGQTVTNYVEWVNDPDSNALSAAATNLTNFSGSTFYSLSGVKYFVSCSASFTYAASNVYKNVYYRASDGISFPTTTNTTVSHIGTFGSGLASTGTTSGATKSLPSLATSANSQNQVLQVTGTITFDPSASLVGAHATTSHTASVSSRVKHPLKSNLTTSTLSKHSFLVFSGSQSSDLNSTEHFDGEVYRLQSGSYTTQNSVTNAGNTWSSTVSINDVGGNAPYSNGMLIYNDKLISPLTGGLSGDFRCVNDGGTLQAPTGNPNYSTLTTATREYYRYFRSNQVGDVSLATVTLRGDANLISKGGAFNTGTLGANKNVQVEVKIPGDSGWLDLARPASLSEDITADGSGGFNGGGGDVNQTIDTDGTGYGINFRTATLEGTSGGNADYLVVRITAHKDWTGYLSRISFTYGS